MNRRSFLGTLVGGVAVAAAARTFPFRIFSFPTTPRGFHFDRIMHDDLVAGENVLTVADIRRIVAQLKNCKPLWPERVVYSVHPQVWKEIYGSSLPA